MSGIWTGPHGAGFFLFHNVWGLSWEDLMFGSHLAAGAGVTWSIFTHRPVVKDGCWQGPQLGLLPKHLQIVSPWDSGFITE